MKAKRFLSVLVCALLALTLLPATASAAEYTITADDQTITIPAGETATVTGNGVEYERVHINCGDNVNLTLDNVKIDNSSYGGGTWGYDTSFFSATFNSPATFTAKKAGTSVITYTVDGVSQSVTVTIKQSVLPATGQDNTWIWVLGSLAVICGAGAVLIGRRKRVRA